jgi:serine-type D-Ala-D-Ala carboxypeptidase/endopeptidase (penicillin-binding protein 4)
MKKLLLAVLIMAFQISAAQGIKEKLERGVQKLEADSQMRHAILSLVVLDAKNGQPVYAHHEQIGLEAASCQKLFTSAAAFDLLGHDYRYKTWLRYDGRIEGGTLTGDLHLIGSGDPTLGSWRWKETKEDFIFDEIISTLKKNNINKISGKFFMDDSKFSIQPIPDGWIWGDIGNYYGAGCWGINWRENQYDMLLKPGSKIGDTVEIISVDPAIKFGGMINEITTGEKGSGDNGYIYLSPYGVFGFTEGTIPIGTEPFTISGSIPDPSDHLSKEIANLFTKHDLSVEKGYQLYREKSSDKQNWPPPTGDLLTIFSPTLDSINYWFLKKSINLYGEALIKTLSYEKTGMGSTERGVGIVKEFWKGRGIENAALNIVDGSGLSPQNRVTTDALVKVLQYAKSRSWYPSFYSALPEINGMKMKSGSIGGARSYAGFQTSRKGKEYIFAIVVNNYDGSSSRIIQKLWQLLDLLK